MLKNLLKSILVVAIGFGVYAEVVVSENKVVLPVDISTAKLKFTNLGYGETFMVKVIVPELANHTLLNHRNEGEDGPCLFTYGARQVDQVVQGRPEVEDVEFTVTHKRSTGLNFEGVCKVTLIEELRAQIRGFEFFHQLFHELPDRVEADCL